MARSPFICRWASPATSATPKRSSTSMVSRTPAATVTTTRFFSPNGGVTETAMSSPCTVGRAAPTAGSAVTIEQGTPLVMGTCSIVQIDRPTRDLHALARVALGVVEELGDVDPIRTGLLAALDEAVLVLDTREPLGEDFYASVPAALRVARQAVAACGPAANVDVTAAGHAHIDVAWLWPVAQTRRKAGRTFHNALRLMDEFSDFSLHAEPATAVRLRAQRLPRPLRIDQEAGCRGSLGADWWHVGRSRLQHHRRRGARSPVRARTHVLS